MSQTFQLLQGSGPAPGISPMTLSSSDNIIAAAFVINPSSLAHTVEAVEQPHRGPPPERVNVAATAKFLY